MVLDHIAAIFLFSGPIFYIGLWMAVDPVGIEMLSKWFVRVFRDLAQRFGGLPSREIGESEHADVSRRRRRALRFAGVALLAFAIVI